MICGMSYEQIAYYFLIYSFAGWIVEVIYHAVSMGKIINRGFLNGPVCPVYGFGALSVFAAVNMLQAGDSVLNDVQIFLFGTVLATAVELIAGWLLDQFFHARWWDYSDCPLNVNGYICAKFSLLWGLAVLFVVRVLQKHIEHGVFAMSAYPFMKVVLGISYAVFLIDLIVTVLIIQGFNKKLTELDQIRSSLRIISDRMSDTLGTTTLGAMQFADEEKVQAALARAELKDAVMEKRDEIFNEGAAIRQNSLIELKQRQAELQRQAEELTQSVTAGTYFGKGHLLKAFPDMKHRKYPETVQYLKDRIIKTK